ncbi:MAG: AhpC/TSA family protein [Ktedonobacteraceae bacterium]|nr:AhpC/TSA family protein [Ktedonobacteraceae bacterium]
MTTKDQVPSETLQKQIEVFLAQTAEQLPPELMTTFYQSIDTLVQTDIAKNSLKAGDKAPDFTLPNVFGKQVTLSELLQHGPAVVTFYRGEWCPFCNLQLHAYQNILPQIRELGATLVAISPQTPDNSLSTVEKKELTFTVLSDVGNSVARQYKVVFALQDQFRALYTSIGSDVPTFNGDQSWELPMPGTFIIDQNGTIRLTFVHEDHTRRLEPAALLDSLRAIKNDRQQ